MYYPFVASPLMKYAVSLASRDEVNDIHSKNLNFLYIFLQLYLNIDIIEFNSLNVNYDCFLSLLQTASYRSKTCN